MSSSRKDLELEEQQTNDQNADDITSQEECKHFLASNGETAEINE